MPNTSPANNQVAKDYRRNIAQRAERLFAEMRKLVEGPGSRLQHYQQDFYRHDRNYLVATHATGSYLWTVRETGTELRRIGVTEKDHEWMRAAMSISDNFDVYLVDADRKSIRAVSKQQATDLMKTTDYTVRGDAIRKGERVLAQILVESQNVQGEAYSDVKLDTLDGPPLGEADLVALSLIAQGEVVKRNRSLFAKIRTTLLNGEPLNERLWPSLAAADDQAVFYGQVHASKFEQGFLTSLGVEVGEFHQTDTSDGFFDVKVSAQALAEMEPFSDSFKWDLQRLPYSVRKPDSQVARIAGPQMSADELYAYMKSLRFDQWSLSRQRRQDEAIQKTGDRLERAEQEVNRRVEAALGDAKITFRLRARNDPNGAGPIILFADQGYGVTVRPKSTGAGYTMSRDGSWAAVQMDEVLPTTNTLDGRKPLVAVLAVELREAGHVVDSQIKGDLSAVRHYGRVEVPVEGEAFLRSLGVDVAPRAANEAFVRVRMSDDALLALKPFAGDYHWTLHARSDWEWEPAHAADSLEGWTAKRLATEYAFADFHLATGEPLADRYDGAGVIARDGLTPDAVLAKIDAERARAAEVERTRAAEFERRLDQPSQDIAQLDVV